MCSALILKRNKFSGLLSLDMVAVSRGGEDIAERKVLNHRIFSEHLSIVHSLQSTTNLLPGWNCGSNVIQNRRVFKKRALLDFMNEGNSVQIEEILSRLVRNFRSKRILWTDSVDIVSKLPCAKKEREKAVIIKSPNAMRPCRL
uniref:Uncharacterized protein n=1 Tax=Palpitomonas bilix TaxID=652834 RepID=A0A7S3GBY6_9EUKA|mmetsp:Transcript_39286/g.100685  ORF Transcript_39286/g.100685 Transcript_39286/m.100685 type:complete len:144 (+) Transcript_39286:1061-1492(+)